MYGWMGKLVRVDLSSGKIKIEEIKEDVLENYLGGRGLGTKILHQEVPCNVLPFDEKNKIIFAVGPLTGTRMFTSGRFSATTKSPLTGTIFDANCGGVFAVYFKKCGIDALVIEGRAKKPVYVILSDDNIEIKDDSSLWGKDTEETTNILQEIEGKNSSVLCIGKAGENKVLYSSVIADKGRALGRGGLGAVMGDKFLKAIVAKGKKNIEIKDKGKFDFLLYEASKWLNANLITSRALPEFGTAVLVNLFNELKIFPSYNFQKSSFNGAYNISGEEITKNLLTKRKACFNCPIACGRITKTKKESGEGPEYETVWALGANLGISDLETIAEANYLCNKMGLDTISLGGTLSCAMELKEKNIFDFGIGFNDKEKLKDIIKKIVHLDSELYLGSKIISEKYAQGKYSMQVKGLEFPAYDPRGAKGMGLAFATSNRGACHLRAYMIAPEVLGIPKMIDRFSPYGKTGLTIVFQHTNAVLDSLVLCKFINFALSEEYYARILSAVTGKDFSQQDLQKIGERIWNLERLYNLREGFNCKADTLPERFLKEEQDGNVVELDFMLREYYQARDWSQEGKPTEKKIKSLDLTKHS